ncbi:hypothetical protein [Winogradskyella tangerina]|uniref:hypothetical protein n=1 Tax=Winogradskyella tangerina TaxID=2023240 RepID=UPI000DBE9FF7|nr:hypothetical protein [Winogradskyella tangerina]
MLKFFRKIRRQLFIENKISRYFLYASGEIILVVIGILIAIQINDWNRESVLLSEEKEAYQIIITDLKRDSILFEFYKKSCNDYLDSYFHLNNMKKGKGYFKNSSADLIVSNIEFNPVVQKNNLLIIDKLRNKIIRNQLNSYFRRLNQVQQATQEFNSLITDKSRPFFLEENNIFKNDFVFDNHDRTFPPFKGVSVIDTISLKNTFNKKYFTPILSELRMGIGFYQAALDVGANENHKLIKVLQKEIK